MRLRARQLRPSVLWLAQSDGATSGPSAAAAVIRFFRRAGPKYTVKSACLPQRPGSGCLCALGGGGLLGLACPGQRKNLRQARARERDPSATLLTACPAPTARPPQHERLERAAARATLGCARPTPIPLGSGASAHARTSRPSPLRRAKSLTAAGLHAHTHAPARGARRRRPAASRRPRRSISRWRWPEGDRTCSTVWSAFLSRILCGF